MYRNNGIKNWTGLKLMKLGCSFWPGSEKMKPKCDIEVKKSKSDVMLGLHILAPTVYLNNRLSYGQGQEK